MLEKRLSGKTWGVALEPAGLTASRDTAAGKRHARGGGGRGAPPELPETPSKAPGCVTQQEVEVGSV